MSSHTALGRIAEQLQGAETRLVAEIRDARDRVTALERELQQVQQAARVLGGASTLVKPKPTTPTKRDRKKISPAFEARVRDYIVAHKDGFTRKQMAAELGLGTAYVGQGLRPFFDRGLIVEQVPGGFPRQQGTITYVTPADSPQPPPSDNNGTTETASVPVAGTGRPRLPRAKDKDVRKMLDTARHQGATVRPTGSGQLVVERPNGQRVTISSSAPAGTARESLRRIGLLL